MNTVAAPAPDLGSSIRSAADNSTAHYVPEIDGLRAFAVIAVMVYHGDPEWLPGGFAGVDVFFVISGFLITRVIIAQQSSGGFSLVRFWDRRVRRIVPPALSMIAVCLTLGWLFMTPAELSGLAASAIAALLTAANVYFWSASGSYFDLAAPLQPLLHLWSLGVEEQFYFAYPLVLLAAFRWRPTTLPTVVWGGIIASFATATYTSVHHPSAGFYLPPSRAWELLAGCALALGAIPRAWLPLLPATISCLLAILVLSMTFVFVQESTPWPGPWTVPTIAATMVLISSASSSPPAKAILGSRPAVALGLISYGAYLWHHALLALWRVVWPQHLRPIEIVAILFASLGFAALSFVLIERPSRNWSRFPGRVFWPLLLLSGGATAGGALYLWQAQGVPDRLPPRLQAISTMTTAYPAAIDQCFYRPGTTRTFDESCRRGAPAAPLAMAIIGDSHAVALASGFDSVLAESRTAARLFVAAGCPPITEVRAISKLQQHCAGFNEKVFDWVQARRDIRVVALAARWPYSFHHTFYDNGEGGVELGPDNGLGVDAARERLFESNLRRQIVRLLRSGKTVLLIYPVPEPGWDVPKYLVHRYLLQKDASMPSTDAARWLRRQASAAAMLDRLGSHSRLLRIRPADEICGTVRPGRCLLGTSSWPYYFDDDHPNSLGAGLMIDTAMRTAGNRDMVVSALLGD